MFLLSDSTKTDPVCYLGSWSDFAWLHAEVLTCVNLSSAFPASEKGSLCLPTSVIQANGCKKAGSVSADKRVFSNIQLVTSQ